MFHFGLGDALRCWVCRNEHCTLMCRAYRVCALGCSGDIQIGMVDKKGALEVEVIRARGLVGKPGSKALPGTFSSPTAILSSEPL